MKKVILALVAILLSVNVNAENLSASEKMNQLKTLAVSYKEKKAEMDSCRNENPEKAFFLCTDCKKMIEEIDGLISELLEEVEKLEKEIKVLGNPEDFMNYDFQKSSSLHIRILEICTFIPDYYKNLLGEEALR